MKSIGSLFFQNGMLDIRCTANQNSVMVVYHVTTPFKYSSTNLFATSAFVLTPEGVLANTFVGKNLKGLGSSGVARHYCRNRCLLSFPQGTKMFQFPWLPLPILYIQIRVTRHDSSRVSPFGNLRFKGWLAPPRSLSQLSTSFIGILRQGILCVRLSNFLRFYLSWENTSASTSICP